MLCRKEVSQHFILWKKGIPSRIASNSSVEPDETGDKDSYKRFAEAKYGNGSSTPDQKESVRSDQSFSRKI